MWKFRETLDITAPRQHPEPCVGSRRPSSHALRWLAAAVAAAIIVPFAVSQNAGAVTTTTTSTPTDGYDQKNLKTLVADGKRYTVEGSDNAYFPLEGGYFVSFQFAGVPSGATIESVQLMVEHYEEDGISASPIEFQVGGGSLASPTSLLSTRPPARIGLASEGSVTWDVTTAIDTAAEVNSLKFVVRNQTTTGKKALLDTVTLVVRYNDVGTTPTPPPAVATAITSVPPASGVLNAAYSYQAQATGSTPITWSLPTAPPGMTVNTSTGLVAWTPTSAGTFAVTLRAQNSVGAANQSWQIAVAANPPQATTITLAPVDGWDQKNLKTLVSDGKLYQVQLSDNDWFGVEGGYFLSVAFQGNVPAGATVISAKLLIEHYEEDLLPVGSITWQVAGGALTSPTILQTLVPPLLFGPGAERVVEWDVTAAINTPARANDLKFVLRNTGTNGKKSLLDRVSVSVSYTVAPSAPVITSTPPTAAFVNQAYSYQAVATGTAPIAWALTAAPAGMTVSATGLVAWTPTAAGDAAVTLRASNAIGAVSQSWVISVTVAPPSQVLYVAGDIASCGSSGDEATAALLDANPGGTVLTLGDNVYENGTVAEFANCYNPSWGRHKARTLPSPGNHDYNTPGAPGYFSYFGAAAGPDTRGYRSFDIGAWHIVQLNSEQDFAANGAQLAWLQADLAANSRQCVLAYWHKPRFTSGNYSDFTAYQPFWNALSAAGAEVVLSGHDHNYQRFQPMNANGLADPNGMRQFVVGTGGVGHYPLRPDARRQAANDTAFGVLKLTLTANGYSWNFLPVAGQTFTDSGSGTCR